MLTRAQYDKAIYTPEDSGLKAHREYYSQFVTELVKKCVQNTIPIGRLMSSTDPHFNDIPIKLWDDCSGSQVPNGKVGNYRTGYRFGEECHLLLKAAGEKSTVSVMCCIAKEAARLIVESTRKEFKDIVKGNK